MAMKTNNPWLGLASYDEEKIKEGYKFCGRTVATQELFSIVDNNVLVTMYGKSGIGKSSLLQAGVFPKLRDNNYFPVYIRLGNSETSNRSYAQIIVETVMEELSKAGFKALPSGNATNWEQMDPDSDDYLWHFFVSNVFYNTMGNVVFPVVIIDQFEELFFLDRQRLIRLMRQIYLLIDDSSLASSPADSYVTNYRFLFSIREDDFFRLEDVIEHLRLVEMKYNRYRLTNLSDEEAAEVILQPSSGLMAKEEESAIAQQIISTAKGEDGEINCAILSLLCSRLYESAVAKGYDVITLNFLESFLKGSGGNFLSSFFEDVMSKLNNRAKWEYIEDALVTDKGRRNSVLKSQFEDNAPGCDFLFEGKLAILRTVTYSASSEPHVEIIHDLLADHLKTSRNERRQKIELQKIRRRQRRNAVVITAALFLLGVFVFQYWSILKGRDKLLVTQSKYLSSEAEKEYEKGNITKALRIALYALPKNLDNPDRPYVPEAESKLRECDYPQKDDIYCRSILKHDGNINSAVFSPDGKYIVTASLDNTARVWDAATGKPATKPLKHNSTVNSAVFSPDGKYIVTASWDNTARVWDAATGKPVTEPLKHDRSVSSAVFSPDGEYVVTASKDSTARVWDAATGKPLTEPLKHDGSVFSAVFSPDGKYIVTASGDNTARVWDAATGKPLTGPLKHDEYVNSAVFSPDGKCIVTASLDNTARVWDAATGKLLTEPLKHDNYVNSAVFSPDGKYIVTASLDNTARVWDAATGKPLTEPLKHDEYVNSAVFSPDGKYIVTASFDNTARVWDAITGKPLTEPLKHDDWVRSAVFSPDGKYIVTASGDNTARVWDAATGKPLTEPLKHDNWVYSAVFSPDGKYIVTASWDNTARVWDAATGKLLTEPLKHDNYVNSAVFSPDGKYVVTASWDMTARVWPFPSLQELIDKYRKDPEHDWSLTEEEKKEYSLE